MDWISKLERKFGRYAITNLTLLFIGSNALGYLLMYTTPALLAYLTLEPGLILRGQVWRLITWIVIPSGGNVLAVIIMLFFYYSIGTSMERTWGTFRYNLYLFSGILFTVIGAFILYFIFGGGYGYGSNYYGNYGYNNSYEYAYDPDKSIMMFGLAAGYGKRLNWPDDYFQFMATLNYQLYMMHDWDYFLVNNGNCHNINLELMLQRNSIDNPLYTRKGSQFMLSVAATPPYSLFDGKDYASMSSSDPDKYKFIEYHKWKFKAKIFSPLAPLTVKRTPVLMTRVEYGFLGTYNKNKKSPFETFYMGGDGMSGYSSTYAQETIGLRGYENGSIAGNGGYNSYGYAYSRLAMELRYPFLLEPSSTIYGLVFVEAGNAWTDLKNFNPFNLKRSAGVGVRIFLPMIGLMGLDWAYGFDEPNYGSNGKRSGSNLHFIIGQEF